MFNAESNNKSRYSFAMIVAIGLHLLLFISLVVAFSIPRQPSPVLATKKPVKIVSAVTVESHAIDQEIANIKREEQHKKQQEASRKAKAQRELAAMRRQAKQEELKRQQAAKQLKQLELQKQKQQAQANAEAKKVADALAAKKAAAKQAEADLAKQKAEANKEAQRLQALKKQQQQEQARLAKLKQEQALAEKRHQEQEKKRLAEEQRQKEQAKALNQLMARQLEDEGTQLSTMQRHNEQREIEKYVGSIIDAVGQQWIMPSGVAENSQCELLIKLAPGGTVLSVNILKSSGDAVLDRSARTAVFKASPLPVPESPELFRVFKEIHLTVRPEGYLIS